MKIQKTTLKLSPTSMEALAWWLRHVVTSLPSDSNYHDVLLGLNIGQLYEKKVFPKLATVSAERKIKLSEIETLALTISFLRWDYFEAPGAYQACLYSIFDSLPRLRYDQHDRWITPLMLDETI